MRAGSDHFKKEAGMAHIKEADENGESAVLIPDYVKYPREFITYRWFRPILTFILFILFYIIFDVILLIAVGVATNTQNVLDLAAGGYDSLDVSTPAGALINLGGTAVMIPALALANLIAGGRTFKSYESSRGGWNYSIFFKCLLIAIVTVSVPIALDEVFHYGRMADNKFTLLGVLVLTLVCPMQCIAEEFVFRGLIMQTFGSWFRITPLAILISAAGFAAVHPYNAIGVAEIFISGCMFCIAAWAGRGIEVSSALHVANNMAIFYCVGLGFGEITSQVEIRDLILGFAIDALYVGVILYCRKRGMFDKVKKNDAAEWNAKAEAKRARKAAAKAARKKAAPDANAIPADGTVVIGTADDASVIAEVSDVQEKSVE